MAKTEQAKAIAEAFKKAKDSAVSQLCALLPPGTPVSWERWHHGKKHRQYGEVVAHQAWDPGHMIVRNSATGKKSKTGVHDCYGFRVED